MSSVRRLVKEIAPFGSWKSPLTAEVVSAGSLRLGGFAADPNGKLLWIEGRASEAGRCVLVKQNSEGNPQDITPQGFNVRSRVHEYGGGAFAVDGEDVVFSNFSDQRLYKQSAVKDSVPVPLTPSYKDGTVARYADGVFDHKFSRYITVREDHRQLVKEPVNDIVAIQLNDDQVSEPAEPAVLVSGNDFYAFPRISPDGMKLAWIEWCHPNMPWDATSLYVGYMSEDGKITRKICVAGGDKDSREAASEPRWSPGGELFFVSDRGSGFWNLYRWVEEDNKVVALCPMEAEFTKPSWVFGNSSYAFVDEASIVCTYRKRGHSFLALLDIFKGSILPIETAFDAIYNLVVSGDDLLMSAGSPKHPLCIVKLNLRQNNDATILWSSDALNLEQHEGYFSIPRIIEFPTKVPGESAFVNFYPPTNVDFQAPNGEKPPLLVRSHGGPTAEADTTLQLTIQYWTSRGWAFADVNYGGSTGYGRAYRERLYGKWGIVDVDDCCSCATYLVESGEVDEKRLCIDGRSAGGYTTLAALAFRDTFKAGASLYGVSDLGSLVEDTHKFESRYMISLLGEDANVLRERSPIYFTEQFSCPVILFQGLEDKVVPPNQAEMIYKAIKAKGIPVALVEYEGEQHGFRKAENIKYTLEQEMVFFARLVGGFKVADDILPVEVDNL